MNHRLIMLFCIFGLAGFLIRGLTGAVVGLLGSILGWFILDAYTHLRKKRQ